ncbi:hypothetical protein Pcinc_001841 [Petrolisthes cinctipes]|uniref:Uncharacterized protein n=1 Tax=Petrolisthes cinctipes TaxID=88211 RepID=A0AAE1GM17_PETCI|nr:hypothetical protein Pcinc_001841 [Petrolisthes cinctipes]
MWGQVSLFEPGVRRGQTGVTEGQPHSACTFGQRGCTALRNTWLGVCSQGSATSRDAAVHNTMQMGDEPLLSVPPNLCLVMASERTDVVRCLGATTGHQLRACPQAHCGWAELFSGSQAWCTRLSTRTLYAYFRLLTSGTRPGAAVTPTVTPRPHHPPTNPPTHTYPPAAHTSTIPHLIQPTHPPTHLPPTPTPSHPPTQLPAAHTPT